MHLIMQPDTVYRYPIWTIAVLMAGLSALGTVLLELIVRRFISPQMRREHNEATAAVFSVVGVTFAVLLAFVAMATWENFNKAKAASYTEAALVLDVEGVLIGLVGPQRQVMQADLIGYLKTVINVEWPAQARGQIVDRASASLEALNHEALMLRPSSLAEGNLHALLLQTLIRLRDARQDRMLAAQTSVPAIVWIVTVIGGGLTITFSSFLGVAKLGMHLAMSCALAVSGALVLIMILALSNPFRGDLRVSMQPFERSLERVQTTQLLP